MKTRGRGHSIDKQFIEGPGELFDGELTSLGVHDELGDHRVVVRGDLRARFDTGIPADAVGNVELVDRADLGRVVGEWVLGQDPGFDGVPAVCVDWEFRR